MKLKLNREYAARHLFVTFVMLSLFCWFGFDAVVRYPATDPKVLYVSIEGAEPPANFDLESFKAQKTKTQYGFSLATLIVALVVGLRLLNAWHLDFAFDDDGFSYNGRRFAYGPLRARGTHRYVPRRGNARAAPLFLQNAQRHCRA